MTFKDIAANITLLSPIVLIGGLLLGLYLYKFLDTIHRNIVWYLIVMLFFDVISRMLGYSGNNLIILLVYSFFEMALFMYFYFKFLFKRRHWVLLGFGVIAAIYIIGEIIILNKTETSEFQSYSKVIDNFIVIMLALAFFHERINRYRDSKWTNFGLNTAILIFFTVNMFFFLPINFLINETSGLKHYFWIGNLFITVLFYLYLIWLIWKNGRTRRL